jgi:uncharacterized protein (TIGR02678 family)
MTVGGSTSNPPAAPVVPERKPVNTKPVSREIGELSQLVEEERQRAMRALLRHPLLLADAPEHRDLFAAVRRHADHLRTWFARYPGWSFELTSECARLFKTTATPRDATRAARNPHDDEPLSRRRYIVLCLALAVLVRSERQISLGELARGILGSIADDTSFGAHGITFDLEQIDSRRDLVAVLRVLLGWRALVLVDGETERFAQRRDVDALYDVRHHVVFRLLACRRPPASINEPDFQSRLVALIAEPAIADEIQRSARIRAGLVRRLLDDPVLYPEADLTTEERDYLAKQRPHLLPVLARSTGLHVEDRADGLALADPTGDCTDLGLPETGTEGHATLLVAEHLGRRRIEAPGALIPLQAVEEFLADEAAKHRRFWAKEFTQPGSQRALARIVLPRLTGLGLVRLLDADTLVVMPAIHRYRHVLRPRSEPSVKLTPDAATLS